MSKFDELKKQELEKTYSVKCQEYVAVSEQLRNSLNEAEKVKLKRQREEIGKAIQKIEKELSELEGMHEKKQPMPSPSFYRQKHRDLEDIWPHIDFEKAKKIFEDVMRRANKDRPLEPVASLFLVHDSLQMGGEWLVAHIKQKLYQDDVHFHDPYEIEFGWHTQLSELGFLDELARYFSISQKPETPKLYAASIIGNLLGALTHRDSVIFFEIRLPDNPFLQRGFLDGFLNNFWKPLVASLPKIQEEHPLAKFVAIIVVYPEISAADLTDPCFCTPDCFSNEKILVLPLEQWPEDEITERLLKLPLDLRSSEIYRIGKKIYKHSKNGIPSLACNAIRNWWYHEYEKLKEVSNE